MTKGIWPAVFVAVLVALAGLQSPSITVSAAGHRQSAAPSDRLAWTEYRDGQWDLYVGTVDGAERVRITTTPERELHPTWSPDGMWLAFSHGDVGGAGVTIGGRDLFVAGLDGEPPRRVASGPVLRWAWSPTSDRLLYTTATPGWTCELRDVETRVTGGWRGWGGTLAYSHTFFPAWLPNGDLVALRPGHGTTDPGPPWRLSSDVEYATPLTDPAAARPPGLAPVLPLGASPDAATLAWLAADPTAREEWLAVSSDGAGAAGTPEATAPIELTPLARLAAGPSFGSGQFLATVAAYGGCMPPREAGPVWTPAGDRLAALALTADAQHQPINLRFPGRLNEPPPGVERPATPAPDPHESLDPLNLDVRMVEVVVLNVRGGPDTALHLPLTTLLGAYADDIDRLHAEDAHGLAREKNLGIASLAWLGDTGRLVYAVAQNAPRTTDYSWRFFTVDPASGDRAEILAGGDDVPRAYITCCGRQPSFATTQEVRVTRGQGLFTTKGCIACHQIAGVQGAIGTIGPNLSGMGDTAARPRLVDGSENTPENVARWLLNPRKETQAIMAMPNLGLTDAEATDLAAFLATLR